MEKVKGGCGVDSILTSIKKMLGIVEEYEQFDQDIVIHINTVLTILSQLGVGPTNGFSIKDKTATWQDFVGDNPALESIKSYIYLKVRLIFDPPLSSVVTSSIEKMISELEWRILVTVDPPAKSESEG